MFVHFGDSYLTFTTSLDISPALIPSLFGFIISSQRDSKKEVRNNTVESTEELYEGFYVLITHSHISQKSLDIMYQNCLFSR